jgi:hypothetical protein
MYKVMKKYLQYLHNKYEILAKPLKEIEDCVNYVKNRKLVMNFTILWNVNFLNVKENY